MIKAQRIVGLSCAVPFEEIEVKNRTFHRCRRYELVGRRFRRRMRLSFLPQIAVSENLFDNLFFLDKSYDPHFAAALRTLQRIDLIDQLNQCRPRQSAFPPKDCVRLRHSGQCGCNRLFCLLCHPPFLIRIPAVKMNLMFPFIGTLQNYYYQEQCAAPKLLTEQNEVTICWVTSAKKSKGAYIS